MNVLDKTWLNLSALILKYIHKLPYAVKLKLEQVYKVSIALLWKRTSLNPVERKLRKERKNPAYSHHYPIEGAVTQQINLPIPKNYHEQYKILVK